MTALIEPHYLPSISFFSLIDKFDSVLLEKHEHFVKQSFRNRCYINTAHGRQALIVPTTGKHGKVPFKDVRIDYSQKWVNIHWRTIVSAYGNAPFFEYYCDDIRRILFAGTPFLYDLNMSLLTLCLKNLKTNKAIKETLSYETNYSQDIFDFRSLINAKNTSNAEKWFKAVPYQQVFGNAFVANLSILDLIFCCGPEAGSIMKASAVPE